MPAYDYQCKECGHKLLDHLKGIKEDHPTTCPVCGKEGLEQHHFTAEQHMAFRGKHWHEASGKRGKF